ncbi:hypothetical protein RHMOL_Rhmol02G0310100 [Rhododendron molle]|uniref:Uncharacterized protein n=1 Tax=Rhododendron molle TaxID=49168 RepID=A0ACC0PYW6_RHOML|nr:hypothetical protein RHMOL_Rhmol02G0310100 [Rhododendron molle]
MMPIHGSVDDAHTILGVEELNHLPPDFKEYIQEERLYWSRFDHDGLGQDAECAQELLGLPGRVFLHQFPEFTPHVKHYTLKEYPQRDLALRCEIGSSLALPVFEHSSHTCVGVLEIVSSFFFSVWSYKYFLRRMYDIFQEVGLQCFDGYKHCELQIGDENIAFITAFQELKTVLETVCRIHKLPLAMTWVPCSACNDLRRGQLLSEVVEFTRPRNDCRVEKFIEGQKLHSVQKIQAKGGGETLQIRQLDQASTGATHSGTNVVSEDLFFFPLLSEDQNYILPSLEALQNGEVTMQLDSSHQPPLDPPTNGQDVVIAERNIVIVTSSEERERKTQRENKGTGVRIEVSLDDILKCAKLKRKGAAKKLQGNILKCAKLKRKGAAKKLQVSISTLKRVWRGHGIDRWPPRNRNIEKFRSFRPSPVENEGQTQQRLNSDLPSNHASNSVAHTKPAFQDADIVQLRRNMKIIQ